MKYLLTFAFALATLVSTATTNEFEVLTVREDGIPPCFSNMLGTVSQVAQLQAQITLNAKMAEQAEQVYGQTTGMLQKVAAQLVHNQSIAYADYFLVSFAAAMVIDGSRDKVALYRWEEAPPERQRGSPYKSFDCYYAFKGECDIQQLKQIFKISGILTTPCSDWTYMDDTDVDEPVPQGPWTDKDGVVYNYSYRTTVHLPDDTKYFLVIHIRDQSADTDGSTLLVYGGDAGCKTGKVVIGNTEITYVGGRAVEWRTIE